MQAQFPATTFGAVEKWVSILQKCRQGKSLEHAKRLHALLCEQSLEAHPVIANYLIPALVQCGSLRDAQLAFDSVQHRNHHSWNSLISGYLHHGEPHQAVLLFHEMQKSQDCTRPDTVTYLAILNACVRLKDLDTGHTVHNQIIQRGMERDLLLESAILGNTLVDMYGKCGSLSDACRVFYGLPTRNAIAWAAMITAYNVLGLADEAWICLQQMQLCGTSPDSVTFVCSLKARGSMQALEAGRKVHAETFKRGMEAELYVGSALVDMYSDYGLLSEAQQVFDGLVVRNTVSWNTLITGYTENCQGMEALRCLQEMKSEGKSPDIITYLASLKACCSIQALEIGRAIHAEATKRGLHDDLYVSSSLVDVYVECCSFGEAFHVFNGLPVRDVVSWNALIAGYVGCGGLKNEAENCFRRMLLEGISPDPVTFVGCLRACAKTKALEKGRRLHSEVTKRGWEGELYVAGTLSDMYSECGSPVDVCPVFDKLAVRDAVTWAALAVGYATHGFANEIGGCFGKMLADGTPPDLITFCCILKACGNLGDSERGRELHSEAVKRGFERELSVGNVLVDMYGKCGSILEAHHMFDNLVVRDAGSWAALIEGCTDQGLDDEVKNCFQQMQHEDISPDGDMFVCFLKACGNIGAVETGQIMHDKTIKRGLEREPHVGTTLVDMYGKYSLLVDARGVFDQMSTRHVESWAAMIKAYGKNHEGNMAVKCFDDMQEDGVKPCSITFICLLAACSYCSLVLKGLEYFKLMVEKYLIKPTMEHLGCMVDLFARSGHTLEAEKFAAAMRCPPSSIMLYHLLSTCTVYGSVKLAEKCFQQLVELQVEDTSAYLLLADVYATAGRWSDAKRLEETRKRARAKKTPGSAFIEVNGKLHTFLVSVNKSKGIPQTGTLVMRKVGYVPVLDLVST